MASASITTILIIGGTSGIGAAFARRFHSKGKQVIVTGRRENRLQALRDELPGLETYVMDNTDLAALPGHVDTLTSKYPDIDTVWINSGVQHSYTFADITTSSDAQVVDEVTTNVTAPLILARHFIPYLLSLNVEANFIITSSGLAFVPMGIYPIYCPTKALIHHFLVGLRQQLKDSMVNIIEIDPPYVATDLDANHRLADAPPPMPLDEFTDKTFAILDQQAAKELKEVAVGFAAMGVNAWRQSIGEILNKMHLGG